MKPLVSILVPVYNVGAFLEKNLVSLFEQTFDKMEFIFVNDASTDNSMQILNEVLEYYPNRKEQVHIMQHSENKGLAAARTTALQNAHGDYLLHVDSDDWLELDMVEKMYQSAIYNNADIVCCGINLEYPNMTKKECYSKMDDISNFLGIKYLEGGIYSSLCNKLIRRELYINNNILPYENIQMWEDLGQTFRLRFYASKIICLKECLYHYNKMNINSVSIPKEKNILDQIKCAQLLEDLLIMNNALDKYNKEIAYLKLKSKQGFIVFPQLRDLEYWCHIYEKTHKYIWTLSDIPCNLRVIYWLLDKKYFNLASILLKFRDKKLLK